MSEKKIIITPEDNLDDTFTHSNCECDLCKGITRVNKEWEEYVPITNLQKRMVSVISRIESREKEKETRRPTKRRKK